MLCLIPSYLRVTVDTRALGMTIKPLPLFTGREAAHALGVTVPRFNRAVRSGLIRRDCISNSGDFFFVKHVRELATKLKLLFP
jgi:hypothetical protein